jgi:hypothetical protein
MDLWDKLMSSTSPTSQKTISPGSANAELAKNMAQAMSANQAAAPPVAAMAPSSSSGMNETQGQPQPQALQVASSAASTISRDQKLALWNSLSQEQQQQYLQLMILKKQQKKQHQQHVLQQQHQQLQAQAQQTQHQQQQQQQQQQNLSATISIANPQMPSQQIQVSVITGPNGMQFLAPVAAMGQPHLQQQTLMSASAQDVQAMIQQQLAQRQQVAANGSQEQGHGNPFEPTPLGPSWANLENNYFNQNPGFNQNQPINHSNSQNAFMIVQQPQPPQQPQQPQQQQQPQQLQPQQQQSQQQQQLMQNNTGSHAQSIGANAPQQNVNLTPRQQQQLIALRKQEQLKRLLNLSPEGLEALKLLKKSGKLDKNLLKQEIMKRKLQLQQEEQAQQMQQQQMQQQQQQQQQQQGSLPQNQQFLIQQQMMQLQQQGNSNSIMILPQLQQPQAAPQQQQNTNKSVPQVQSSQSELQSNFQLQSSQQLQQLQQHFQQQQQQHQQSQQIQSSNNQGMQEQQSMLPPMNMQDFQSVLGQQQESELMPAPAPLSGSASNGAAENKLSNADVNSIEDRLAALTGKPTQKKPRRASGDRKMAAIDHSANKRQRITPPLVTPPDTSMVSPGTIVASNTTAFAWGGNNNGQVPAPSLGGIQQPGLLQAKPPPPIQQQQQQQQQQILPKGGQPMALQQPPPLGAMAPPRAPSQARSSVAVTSSNPSQSGGSNIPSNGGEWMAMLQKLQSAMNAGNSSSGLQVGASMPGLFNSNNDSGSASSNSSSAPQFLAMGGPPSFLGPSPSLPSMGQIPADAPGMPFMTTSEASEKDLLQEFESHEV